MPAPVRHKRKRNHSKDSKPFETGEDSNDSSFQNDENPNDNSSFFFSTKAVIPISCLLIAFCIGYKGYLETRINTPFEKSKVVQKSGLAVPDRYWGSYRPNVYFGMKTRDPYSLVTGIMWYYPDSLRTSDDIRHWCEQTNYLKGYSWIEHDGKNFGIQTINDNSIQITTSFVKKLRGSYGGDWTAKVSFDTNDSTAIGETVSLIFYTAIENQTVGDIRPYYDELTGVTGMTEGLGEFSIMLENASNSILHESYIYTSTPGLDTIKDTILNSLSISESGKKYRIVLPGDLSSVSDSDRLNLVATQVTFKIPFDINIIFESGSASRPEKLCGKVFKTELAKHRKLFQEKFENIFGLKSKGFSAKQIDFAKASFSNLVGGIGYFYGSSRVLSEHTDSPVPYWKAPLYTAVPSRSFFPRGFLWDEGFHGLLIASWDLDIELDIISHWFDLMNVEGWIPREQILGSEALKRVPPEFVTQINTNANPPVFLLTLQFILRNFEEQLIEQSNRLETLDRLYTRLVAWFDWFNTTQNGIVAGTYRWRGRDPNVTTELNPKTLSSGLDDYPRASHPTDIEAHVDLRCWITLSASALTSISMLLNKPSKRFSDTASYLMDNMLLDKYHWSEQKNVYADYGLHTDDVELRLPLHPRPGNSKRRRVVLKAPIPRLVDTTFGYNSLFPLMLQILDPYSDTLGKTLNKLKDPELLWTKYGLRSLSKSSPLYMVRNTDDDPPYWRGAIWINMNYLIIRALSFYSGKVGPYNKLAKDLYAELRDNVINNIYKEYVRTGYLWENYNDFTGQGQGSRPFNGWTSLVVLLMAEIY